MSANNFVLIKETSRDTYHVSENDYETVGKIKDLGIFNDIKIAIQKAEKHIAESEFGVEYGIRFDFIKSREREAPILKIFDEWNKKKKKISENNRVNFQKGDIWIASIGKNLGDEEDGKHSYFERPVLIIRKFNNNIFLGVPLTTNQKKQNNYYHKLNSMLNSSLILSQIRLFDAKRLLRYMNRIANDELKEIKLKIGKII
jgi:mRNA interferase MazF